MTEAQVREKKRLEKAELQQRARKSGIRVINKGKTYYDVAGKMIKMARQIQRGEYLDVTVGIIILKCRSKTGTPRVVSTAVGSGTEGEQMLMLEMVKKAVIE